MSGLCAWSKRSLCNAWRAAQFDQVWRIGGVGLVQTQLDTGWKIEIATKRSLSASDGLHASVAEWKISWRAE